MFLFREWEVRSPAVGRDTAECYSRRARMRNGVPVCGAKVTPKGNAACSTTVGASFSRYELQYKCQNDFEFSVENAEIMENCP